MKLPAGVPCVIHEEVLCEDHEGNHGGDHEMALFEFPEGILDGAHEVAHDESHEESLYVYHGEGPFH